MASVAYALIEHMADRIAQDPVRLADTLERVGGRESEWLAALVADRLGTEAVCHRAWAEFLGLPFDPLDERKLDPSLLHRLPLDVAKRYGAVVVGEEDGVLTVALRDPFDILAVDTIQEVTGCSVQVAISTPTALRRALARHERGQTGIEGLITRVRSSEVDLDVLADADKLKQVAGDDAVVQLVDYLVDESLRAGASDIHLEPQRDSFRVRIRVDGDLEVVHRFPVGLQRAVCSRLKVLAGMDIGEARKPQDGRFVLDDGGEGTVELRVSSLPSVFGEKIVMRVLDRSALRLELDRLDLSPQHLRLFRVGFQRPNGLVLLTGPTGSGKTTTLYAALNELNQEDTNVITVEDPVEYDLVGTTQVQVDVKAERTFARALRSILRQDPDVVMVGEIRDAETAAIAVQAALTGHMVLSTLHTNDAPGAVFRLLDMGVEPYLLGPALRCVVAQRLVQRVCPDCAEPTRPSDELLVACGLDPSEPIDGLRRGAGCAACRGKGRRGRIAIHEVLSVDGAMSRLISSRADEGEIVGAARSTGYRRLLFDGIAKARVGLITLEDLLALARGD